MEITMLIVGIVIGGLLMTLIAWIWYTKLFPEFWGAYSGGMIPMKGVGEKCMAYMKRMWARGLVQLLVSMIAVFAVLTSGDSLLVPLGIVGVFYLPVIGSRVVWMKGLTGGQKLGLFALDIGYALIALYAVFFFLGVWGERVLLPLAS
jgi:hypothetical protein